MSGGVKRKLDNQSIEKKYEIILQLEKGTKPADLSRQHGIPANTISGWKKKANVIKQMYAKSVFDPARKKLRVAEHKDVDDALFQWFTNTQATNLPVNGPLLMEKADILAAKLGHPDFKASQGWLDRFKKRHNIVFKAICGESAAVQQEQVDSWLKTQMRTILDTYETRNIFNADETGVFWKCLPDKTMAFRGEAYTDAILEEEAQELAITVQEFRDYIEIDKDVVTDGVITDEDIVSSVQSAQTSTSACGNDKEDEEDADEDLEPIPSAGEVVEMLQKIRRYGSFVGDETVLDSINNIEAFVFKQTVKGKKQQSILDFVKKP
ncbi:hypothetical protein KIL84_016851 [Mauremys mutica]|uniref:HTH CENPB-type domain-containing protein n=1 Tax=Mauremys mutica TaxID=74926 RepID=A0A9D3X591_9SAUR|nr:hypothetical protein KIL84_016851 [Mauremys mutica]